MVHKQQDIYINGTRYTARLSIVDDRTIVNIVGIDIEDAALFSDTPTILENDIQYPVKELILIAKNAEGCEVVWRTKTAEDDENDALVEELSDKVARLTAIREAIVALGTGLPTLSKLTAFLNAVKEAIGYDN